MTIVLGTQYYLGSPEAVRRQRQSLDAITGLSGVEPINVQWVEDAHAPDGLETVAVLKRDSVGVSGLAGRRQPILTEVLDALATIAEARQRQYFGFFNADITVTQSAIETILGGGKQTYAFSRMDFNEHGDLSIMTAGLDMFVFDVSWWRKQRRRFRPYILGEQCYDNVCAAIMMCHGNGLIVNRRGDIKHQVHKTGARGAFAEYNWYLATLDGLYFSIWVAYWEALTKARRLGATEEEELELQRAMFVLQPSAWTRIRHTGRCLRAHWRFRRSYGQRIRATGLGRS